LKDDLNNLMQRPVRYWYVDGLTEIGFGLICLVLAAYFFGQAFLPPDSMLFRLLDMGFLFVILGAGWGVGQLINIAKNRLTYPRTGYVAYPATKEYRRWLAGGLGILLGGLLSVLFTGVLSLDWMPTLTGMILAAVITYMGFRIGQLRFFILAFVSLVIGVGLGLARIGNLTGLAVYYTLISLALVVSGALTLYSYIKKTSPPQGDL